MVGENQELTYLVQGSSPDPYVVKVLLSPLSISCTCAAAENGLPCKHRTAILHGADLDITKGDRSKLPSINRAAGAAGVFILLGDYDNAKTTERTFSEMAEKAFKKYMAARIAYMQKQTKTERAVIKNRDAMEAAIEDLNIKIEKRQEALKALRIFYTPSWDSA